MLVLVHPAVSDSRLDLSMRPVLLYLLLLQSDSALDLINVGFSFSGLFFKFLLGP